MSGIVTDGLGNLSEVLLNIPDPLTESVLGLIFVLKAVGIAFIIYVIYSLIMAVINFRRLKLLRKLDSRMNNLEKKIDLILKHKKRKKK